METQEKVDLSRKYFLGGCFFLPFLWAVNAVWFFKVSAKTLPLLALLVPMTFHVLPSETIGKIVNEEEENPAAFIFCFDKLVTHCTVTNEPSYFGNGRGTPA